MTDVPADRVTGTRSLDSFSPAQSQALPPVNTNGEASARGHVGEVVESSTTTLVAEARRLHGSPDFGAFVRIESSDSAPMVGVVHNASTASIETNRRPMAYGKTESELRSEQPQIFELLRTQFDVLILGYLDSGAMVHLFPPQPARIHSFVFPCDAEQICTITDDPQFLRSLLEAPGIPTDELLLATLRHALDVRADDTSAYLASMGSELSRLLRDDYDRLTSIIRILAGRGERR